MLFALVSWNVRPTSMNGRASISSPAFFVNTATLKNQVDATKIIAI